MMLASSLLAAVPNLRHAFFTREGGVSDGIYASLNGGLGSRDNADHVRENRARMAAVMNVAPDNFLTAYQVHSPDVAVAEAAWDSATR
ncbi:MAG: laccase domain-containing protein, partial [Rhizobiales bacterium]|nr:laccase domain-containing protein [Hyphomicrobiales bacterium]